MAEAEFSGDTVAVLRVQLQEAQQQFLQATERNKAGLASEHEVEKAKLAKDLAEARLSGDATAIARTELQLAQQEFLRIEGLFKARLVSQAEFEKAKAARDAALAEYSAAGNRTNIDLYSSRTIHTYLCGGKPFAGLEGWEQGWRVENGGLMNTGETVHISTKTRFGKEDLTVYAALSLDYLNGSGAAFIFGEGYAFGFDRTDGRFTVSSPTVLRSYQRGSAAGIITPGKRFIFTALRRGSLLDFLIDQKLVLSVQFDGKIGTVGFAPGQGTMRIYAFGAYEMYPDSTPKAAKAPNSSSP